MRGTDKKMRLTVPSGVRIMCFVYIYVDRLPAAVSCVVLGSCFGGMTSEQADFAVLDITLRRMDFYSLRSCGADAESRPGILETICNCLVLIPHWQEVDQLDRLTLFRLADVLYVLDWHVGNLAIQWRGQNKNEACCLLCATKRHVSLGPCN